MTSKRAKLGIFFIVVSLALTFYAAPASWAIPASPFPFKTTLPDGTTIELYQRGDEFLSWVESPEGYTVLKNETTGYWEYAVAVDGKLVTTGVTYRPGETPPAGLDKHQKPKSNAAFRKTSGVRSSGEVWTPRPLAGTRKVMLIRVEFDDR
jgi:hypothetical protein